ncbi:MAG: hypothetical protein CMO80_23965 [Verrucomicrobiales bacterium]|nr:hypothetical protein [Verrucomicrobiales bacterium]|tara:strand:+ start:152 stop:394 length:243 start_codon:yes stop_codon:yes gene_type:complete
MKALALSCCLLTFASGSTRSAELTPEALTKQVRSLKQDKVAWRQIEWRSCLLQGLAESRKKNKPVVLWIFIDRPIDDERC